MKNRHSFFILIIFGSGFFHIPAAGQSPHVRIVQPYENANLPAIQSSFVFGSVTPATATLIINGIPVKPHTNGGFLTMIPFQPGAFTIEAVAFDGSSTATATRTVAVAEPRISFADDSSHLQLLSPLSSVAMRAGELLTVTFQAAPNGTATFRIGSHTDHIPMLEQPGMVRGIYRGAYKIQPNDKFDKDFLVINIKRADGQRKSLKTGVHLSLVANAVPKIVELIDDAVLLTGPAMDFGYALFPLKGVHMEVVGEQGDFVRVAAGSYIGWVRKINTRELSAGSIPSHSVAANLRVTTTDASTIIELPLQARHLHQVEEYTDPNKIQLTLWGVTADSDRVRYREKNSLVKEITWRQPEPGTFVLDIQLHRKHPWGYDVRYEGNVLVMELRRAPMVGVGRNPRLKGLKVVLDPGHGPMNFGTIGPLGNTEATVVLQLAEVMKKELEKRGAEVIITRDHRDMNLRQRTELAWKEKGHVFISLHCDAIAEGQDPRKSHGYSVHYYSAQSRLLADALHSAYGERVSIPDQGMWRSNLAVCRLPQMPSVLFELGFLIMPEFEELVLTPAFQQIAAESVAIALQNFILKAR
jgi:N-acetylmuramoyl-L-alanine amidase